MRPTTCLAVAAFLTLACCNNSRQDSGFGSGTLKLTNAPQAFTGWEGERMIFVVIPTFDWVEGAEIQTGSEGDVTTGGNGREWWGRVNRGGSHEWEYRIGQTTACFGNQNFELADGEVFVLKKGYSPIQLKGSLAGKVNDEENRKRLSELLENYKRESKWSRN